MHDEEHGGHKMPVFTAILPISEQNTTAVPIPGILVRPRVVLVPEFPPAVSRDRTPFDVITAAVGEAAGVERIEPVSVTLIESVRPDGETNLTGIVRLSRRSAHASWHAKVSRTELERAVAETGSVRAAFTGQLDGALPAALPPGVQSDRRAEVLYRHITANRGCGLACWTCRILHACN
ncbi:hypothetical protein [Actinomadura sp. BRA 177]|uniref:hypothetical protein n=1 Tax=Actinomadura sp. BRA 177 TaxID=2745202 RepID=UPI001595EB25|nr:hypothetical protein [Actinomadura sp. BRA 177]NVI88088.1 hypothetical protein [Actinomadura sp. BRA 177]